jgi:hypothetical protein
VKKAARKLALLLVPQLLLWSDATVALDVNVQNAQNVPAGQGIVTSMDDVARMIRQKKKWQILDARPRYDGATTRYRFKLLGKKGKVKIISIDPRKPNLRRLEQ